MVLFDHIVNNADRKSATVTDASGKVWGIDHGLTFNREPKLRTRPGSSSVSQLRRRCDGNWRAARPREATTHSAT